MIYADNAATSFPKSHDALAEMVEVYEALGASPGRGSYDLSRESEDLVDAARRQVCAFFGGDDPSRVAFAYNATDALNILIQGLIEPGCHVVSSRLEHNSVLRPLYHFLQRGEISLDLAPFNREGFIDPEDVHRALRPETRFVILTHGSNVLGTIQPVEEIAALCRNRRIPLILDVTQTAGLIPIDMKKWGVSAVAFTGHKALYGPTGIGGLVLEHALDVRATRFGGTGLDSRSLLHSQSYPHRLEAGTINLLGIIGLCAGIRSVDKIGLGSLYAREMVLTEQLLNGLTALEGVKLYCARSLDNHLPILLCNVDGINPEQVSAILDGDFGICTRAGLQCAPLVHQDLGTSPLGAMRISLGRFNTTEEIDQIIAAMDEIIRSLRLNGK
jgi:cysteine desulfurase / selenocysteine lyase